MCARLGYWIALPVRVTLQQLAELDQTKLLHHVGKCIQTTWHLDCTELQQCHVLIHLGRDGNQRLRDIITHQRFIIPGFGGLRGMLAVLWGQSRFWGWFGGRKVDKAFKAFTASIVWSIKHCHTCSHHPYIGWSPGAKQTDADFSWLCRSSHQERPHGWPHTPNPPASKLFPQAYLSPSQSPSLWSSSSLCSARMKLPKPQP